MREEILNGKLEYPGTAIFMEYPDQIDDIKAFWKALWLNFLAGHKLNAIKWYNQLGGKLYNDLVKRLDRHGWVESNSVTARNWADLTLLEDKILEFVTPDELRQLRTDRQYDKYVLERKEARASKLVRQNGKTKRTGLVRKGFRNAGNTQFGYDMDALGKYEKAVKLNLTKSMDKIRDEYPEMKSESFSYDVVSTGIYDLYSQQKLETYTTGESISDSRGRAISQALTKVANPISSKDFRAALVITYE